MDKIDWSRAKANVIETARQLGLNPKKAGKDWVVLCPFHEENNPSCTLYPDHFYCFSGSCEAHGDAVDLVVQVNGCNKIQAYEWITGERVDPGGHEWTQPPPRKAPPPAMVEPAPAGSGYDPKGLYYLIREIALSQPDTPAGGRAWSYILDRGIDPDLVIKAGGFVLNDPAALQREILQLIPHLPTLQAAGVVNYWGGFAFSRHPIVFPYFHPTTPGHILTMQARTIDPDTKPKYLFLSGQPKTLWGMETLRTTQEGETVFLTEGIFDALTIRQAGGYALAIPGSSLPPAADLQRLQPFRVVLVMDNDKAGETARPKVLAALQAAGVYPRIGRPKSGKDVNEAYLRAG